MKSTATVAPSVIDPWHCQYPGLIVLWMMHGHPIMLKFVFVVVVYAFALHDNTVIIHSFIHLVQVKNTSIDTQVSHESLDQWPSRFLVR
jgi:galactitol-specific phosphotransferase system IIC component